MVRIALLVLDKCKLTTANYLPSGCAGWDRCSPTHLQGTWLMKAPLGPMRLALCYSLLFSRAQRRKYCSRRDQRTVGYPY